MNKRICLVNLSFDDGRIDNYTIAYHILKKYHLPATFNITTGYINGEMEHGNPTDVAPMTVDMVKELAGCPEYEIAGHGHLHQNNEEDIVKGIDNLKSLAGKETLTDVGNGFASPGTGLNKDVWERLCKKNPDISYARVSLRYKSFPRLKTFLRKLSRVVSLPILYRMAYADTLISENDNQEGYLYSVPVLSTVTVSQIDALLRYAIKHNRGCILMLHSIAEDGKVHDNWDYERSKFEELCRLLADYQDKGLLQVTTSAHITESFNITH